ncbi:MAG TPA: nucleotidyl transferase AbiEii/AbiGii toxin family protein [Longimicrobiales bacterium]|nr:nucleotidyl transferase AbiEii/AbiGii toxin family protein [Longimicrobiales bacterium]
MSSTQPDFGDLIARLARALADQDVPFMLIGGQAVLLHGEPRLTQDVDVTLGVPPTRLVDALAACEATGLTPLPEDVTAFVRDTFVLPTADPQTGIRVDLIFSTTPYEAQAIERSVFIEVNAVHVPFASAEDLILHKLFAGRPRDIEDAAGVVRRKGRELDWVYIRAWAVKFSVVPGREHLLEQVRALERERHP